MRTLSNVLIAVINFYVSRRSLRRLFVISKGTSRRLVTNYEIQLHRVGSNELQVDSKAIYVAYVPAMCFDLHNVIIRKVCTKAYKYSEFCRSPHYMFGTL